MAGHRRPSRVASASALILLLSSLSACGDDGDGEVDAGQPAEAPLEVSDVPDTAHAYALPLDALIALEARASAQAEEHEASVEGVRWSMAAARLARVLALRTDGDARAEHLDAARRALRSASRRKALEGACEASIALARFEARDAGDLSAAYEVAYRTSRRFSRQDEPEGARARCLAEARRITEVLEAHRPSAERLAAIDADPDADDPSAAFAGESAQEVDVSGWARGREDVGSATLRAIEVYGAAGSSVVRVVLMFDGVAVFERGELPAENELPRRAYLDLAGTTIAGGAPRNVPVEGAGLVRVRAAPFAPGTTRVVFDLEPSATYRLFFLTDPYRIVVDFESDGSPPIPAVAAGEARAVRTIVLDPGHGGNEFGARFNGLTEANLTLDITQRVAAILERRVPEARILLTRSRDRVVSLEQRVAFANSVGADAFVSVHLNAADDPVEHGGVATFVLDTTNDRQAIRLAARENGTSTDEVTGLQRILAGLYREDQVSESRSLAELVQIGTLAGGRRMLPELPDRGVKSAMFYVLVGARMPAILVEASFITQPEENRALATARYRQLLAEGIAEGIVRWVGGASAPTP